MTSDQNVPNVCVFCGEDVPEDYPTCCDDCDTYIRNHMSRPDLPKNWWIHPYEDDEDYEEESEM